ncbi:MAG TPA: molybdopterin biosynthesis protein [Nitrospirae bacterium]|nr:molybdopterin biosynthesis protein [Nitrospirota bacterium]
MKQIFHRILTSEDALRKLIELVKAVSTVPISSEVINTIDSKNRVTAKAVFALYSSPAYHSSAMDGYAVRFVDTLKATERQPVRLKIGSEAIYVDTGDPLPEGFDAVIMIEDVNVVDESIEIYKAVSPYQHVRVVGEDIVATELIAPENHKITPIDMSAMIASGVLELEVRKKPVVSIIPTGTEIIEPEEIRLRPPKAPEIIEYNSVFIKNILEDVGATVKRTAITKDDIELIKDTILREIVKADIVLVLAGSGKGSEDYTAKAISEIGELIINGVAIKPGKPFIAGLVKNKLVLGIPGYPVSAYLCMNLFVIPLIELYLGLKTSSYGEIKALLSRPVPSQMGVDEFIRVKVGKVGEKTITTPLGRGAGLIMSIVRADGIVKIPSNSEGYPGGIEVTVNLIKGIGELDDTILCIGSHDNSLDLLANFLKKRYPRYSLSSAHVGSMGGLVAIKRAEAHMAGCHLLDEITGDYNISFIDKILPDKKIALINLVYREQGLIVPKGNPKKIKDFHDLTREDIVYINRQAGSGTRLLLDKYLKDLNIDSNKIKGYQREEYTHMAVASAVLTGVADTGLAIYSSAVALDLDFVPVANERYDLAIPYEYLELDSIKSLLEIILNDKDFKHHILSMGGYDVKDMGKIIYISEPLHPK